MYQFFYDNFIDVLSYGFYTKAIIASFLVSIVTGLVSIVVVNKNWAMLGMGLSNSVFPGVVLGSQFHFPLAMTLGAFSTGLLCFYLTVFIIRHTILKTDAVLGMCYSSFFAIGIFMLAFLKTDGHITHILFGNLLGIPKEEYIELIIISAIVVTFMVVRFKDVVLFTFDELQFKILGLNYKLFNNVMLVLLTLTIIASLQAIGILLTISYLVLPACTAQQISKRLPVVITLAIASNIISSYFGLTFAYILDISSGPTIVCLQTTLYLLSFVYRRIANMRLRKRKIAKEQEALTANS